MYINRQKNEDAPNILGFKTRNRARRHHQGKELSSAQQLAQKTEKRRQRQMLEDDENVYDAAKRTLRFESFAHWEAIRQYTTEDYDNLRLSMCKKNRFRKSLALKRTRGLMDQIVEIHAKQYGEDHDIWDEDDFFDYRDRVHPLTDAQMALESLTGSTICFAIFFCDSMVDFFLTRQFNQNDSFINHFRF